VPRRTWSAWSRPVFISVWSEEPTSSRRIERCGEATDIAYLHLAGVSARFDVVTSALAIRNIPAPEGRNRALDEARRVLRPGGRLLIADFRHTDSYRQHLGPDVDRRSLGLA